MKARIPYLGMCCAILLASGCTLATKEKEVHPIPEQGETLLPSLNQQQFILNPLDKNNLHSKSKENNTIDWTGIERVLDQAEAQTKSRLVAVFSIRDSLGSWYQYHLQPLGFSPEAMEEAGDGTQLFIYELSNDELGSVPRIAIARIPAGERAFKEMEAWILPKTESSAIQTPLSKKKSNCTWEEVAPAASVCWAGGCSYYPPIYESVCDGPPSGNDDGGDDPNWRWPFGGGSPGSGGGSSGNPDECRPPYGCEEEFDLSNPPPGIPSDLYNKLNEQEKKLCWENEHRCMGVYNAKVYAEEWAALQSPQGRHNGIQDALRHAMWNARMAYAYGSAYAKKWGDAHEEDPNQPLNEKTMDLHNNQVGRDIGQDVINEFEQHSELGVRIINAKNNGQLCLAPGNC